MKHVLRGLGVMLLLWGIMYAIGLTTTGKIRPWEWNDCGFMAFAMGASAFGALGVITISQKECCSNGPRKYTPHN